MLSDALTPSSVDDTDEFGIHCQLPVKPRSSHSPPWKMFLWKKFSWGEKPSRPEALTEPSRLTLKPSWSVPSRWMLTSTVLLSAGLVSMVTLLKTLSEDRRL